MKRPAAHKRRPAPEPTLPTREQLRAFIESKSGRVGKRDIARAFRLGPEHKAAVRDMLRALAAEGVVGAAGDRRVHAAGRLPEMDVVLITGTDPDGDPLAPAGEMGGGRPAAAHPHASGTPRPRLPWPRAIAYSRGSSPSVPAGMKAAPSSAWPERPAACSASSARPIA